MKGITFGNLHSYKDLKLILTKKEIGSPAVKERKIEIEGADGDLDLTEFFGEPKYENATHKFEFSTIVPQAQFLSLFSTVKNALHGKKMRIVLDDDPLFYYMGRVKVSSFTNERNIGMINIECDCEPYKYKVDETVHIANLYGKNIFDCQNPDVIHQAVASYSSLETGIRVTLSQQTVYACSCFKVVPARLVVGKKITASWKTQPEAADKYIFVIGYANDWIDAKKITETSFGSKLTMTVEESYANQYKYIAIWLYASKAVPLNAGDYVDYTDMQIEIGDAATEYEPYVSASNTVNELVPNSRKAVTPVLYSSKPITVAKNGYTLAMAEETEYTVPEFELKEGNNEFTIIGSGLVSFRYQEGSL